MQTSIAEFFKDTPVGTKSDDILRSCVHCGFCLATCPTYNLLGNELDSPRGRIYLMKQVLEGHEPSAKTQLHLDRCLTCRNCETTCPSGVDYHDLLDMGRDLVDRKVARAWPDRIMRRLLRTLIPRPWIMGPMVALGQLVRPLLPPSLKRSVPPKQAAGVWPRIARERRMLVLDGCVQPSMAPRINAAAARVLDRLGIELIVAPRETCCGAVSYHLNAQEESKDFMRRNIEVWWPYVEQGVEAIVMTASGCGAMVKEYGQVLADDPAYAEKAARIAALTKDLVEILRAEDLERLQAKNRRKPKVAFHPPCTLQHGQKLTGAGERILRELGFELTPVGDAHLCCGSAGTYSILQKSLSRQLLNNKLEALQAGGPEVIATANIGCLLHLQSGAKRPVRHWIELLDELAVQ